MPKQQRVPDSASPCETKRHVISAPFCMMCSSRPSTPILEQCLQPSKPQALDILVKNHIVIKPAKYCDAAEVLEALKTANTRSL